MNFGRHAHSIAGIGRATAAMMLVGGVALGVFAGVRWQSKIAPLLGMGAQPGSAELPMGAGTAAASPAKQLFTCGMHPQVLQDTQGECPICHMKLTPVKAGAGTGEAADAKANEHAVLIDPAVVQNMGVRTAPVTLGTVSRAIRVPGITVEPESASIEINLRVPGWIHSLHANTDGMSVKKGEPLFELSSPQLQWAIDELIAARKAVLMLDANSDKSLRQTSESLATAAGSRLISLGLTPEQVEMFGNLDRAPAIVPFLSPITGYVREKASVFSGSAVEAGKSIMRLSRQSTMWIDTQVPQSMVSSIKMGQNATARFDTAASRETEGQVILIHPRLNEATRTTLVRLEVPNQDASIREGMFASVAFPTDVGTLGPTAPRDAIIDTGEAQMAFVTDKPGRFEMRAVVAGPADAEGRVRVFSGLKVGEQVVVSGQFLIDSESRIREAVRKFVGESSSHFSEESDFAPKGMRSTVALPAAAQRELDGAFGAYLAIAEKLGQEQKAPISIKTDTLAGSLRNLHAHLKGDLLASAAAVGDAIGISEAMQGQTTDRQRELFKALGERMIAIADAHPPSAAVAPKLHVMHCPMARGRWLQNSADLANPFYATDMKECGETLREIPAIAPATAAPTSPPAKSAPIEAAPANPAHPAAPDKPAMPSTPRGAGGSR